MSRACELTGKRVVVGRNVSKTKGHPTRTSRTFVPNLKTMSFKSDALGKDITLQIATATLRTINKYGGFDSFIVNFRKNKLTDEAKKIKKQIEKKLVEKNEFANVKIEKPKAKIIEKKPRPKAKKK